VQAGQVDVRLVEPIEDVAAALVNVDVVAVDRHGLIGPVLRGVPVVGAGARRRGRPDEGLVIRRAAAAFGGAAGATERFSRRLGRRGNDRRIDRPGDLGEQGERRGGQRRLNGRRHCGRHRRAGDHGDRLGVAILAGERDGEVIIGLDRAADG